MKPKNHAKRQTVKKILKLKLKTINLLKNNLGVGLVELLVSMLIMAGVAAAIMTAYVNLPAAGGRGSAELALQEDAALAIERMVDEIRGSYVDSTGHTFGTGITEDAVNDTVNDRDQLVIWDENGVVLSTYILTGDGLLQRNSQNLLGDYEFKNYHMRVTNLNFKDNLFSEGINTVTISFGVSLFQNHAELGDNIFVDSFNFSTEVLPHNRVY